jgi:hypothetical protein
MCVQELNRYMWSFHFLCPTVDLTENSHSYYEIYSTLLQMCTVAMTIEAMCKLWLRNMLLTVIQFCFSYVEASDYIWLCGLTICFI